MKRLLALCLLIPFAALADHEDDHTLPTPLVVSTTVSKYRVYSYSVNTDTNTLILQFRGRHLGSNVAESDTTVVVRGTQSQLSGYAVNHGGKDSICDLAFVDVVDRTAVGNKVTVNIRKVVTDCL